MLTKTCFVTYIVLIFGDLNKTQIHKMPYRRNPQKEIGMLMTFNYLNVFKPNNYTEDYHLGKPNDENFLFGI